MSYRFVKIFSFNNVFLKSYYNRYPNIIHSSYDEQYRHLMQQGFGWSDFFQKHLGKLGVDAHEIALNSNLPKAWSQEYNTSLTRNEFLIKRLKFIKPDVVFFQDCGILDIAFVRSLKSEIPSIKIITGWYCSPISFHQLKVFQYFDFVFACSPTFTDELNQGGIKAYQIYHGFEESLLQFIDTPDVKTNDVVFFGSFIPGKDYHEERIRFIENLLKNNLDIRIYGSFNKESITRLKFKQIGYLLYQLLGRLNLQQKFSHLSFMKKMTSLKEWPSKTKVSKKFLQSIYSEPVFGIEMLKRLSNAKIGLNNHVGVAGEYAANIRMFEVTGVGTCLVTDDKKNISKLFEPNNEIVTYNSPEDCADKIKWLLDNPKELHKISTAGQKRTLKDHTLQKRIEKIHNIIISELKK